MINSQSKQHKTRGPSCIYCLLVDGVFPDEQAFSPSQLSSYTVVYSSLIIHQLFLSQQVKMSKVIELKASNCMTILLYILVRMDGICIKWKDCKGFKVGF